MGSVSNHGMGSSKSVSKERHVTGRDCHPSGVRKALPGVAPIEWTPNLLREKGVHSAKNETTVRAGVPASNG